MRLYSLLLLVLLLCGPGKVSGYSRTTFVPRQITFDSTYELAQTNYNFYHGIMLGDAHIYFYATPLYQQSTQAKQLARYFLPHNKCAISLREDGYGDVDPLWLNLMSPVGTSYNSFVSLRPQRTVVGSVLQCYVDFTPWIHGLWFSFTTAAISARHSVHLHETCQQYPGVLPGFVNACQAFNNPDWTGGKFSPHRLKKAGFDDIQLKLGYDVFFGDGDHNHYGAYVVGGFPTGDFADSLVVFEPTVGSTNWSVGAGVNGDYTFLDYDVHVLTWMIDIKYIYVFRAKERRSADLCQNGDWSRYLQLTTAAPPVVVPAINVLTLPMEVTPRHIFDVWMAFNYHYCAYDIEVGYAFWVRSAEKVGLSCLCPDDLLLYYIGNCPGVPVSANNATICESAFNIQQGFTSTIFAPLTARDLNLKSATHPLAISNKIYGAIAYNDSVYSIPFLIGFGGSYEFGHALNALSNWGIWGKFSINL
jgi:hypothetical protein